MSNTFLTTKKVARLVMPRLIENLVMPNLVSNDYSAEYADFGDTIRIRKPTVLEAKDFTVGSSVTTQDITEQSVDVTLNKIATVDVKVNALEAALNMSEEKLIQDFIEPAAVAIAEKINKAGVECAWNIPNLLGTAGTTPDGLDDFSAIRKFLNNAKAPYTDRSAIWDVNADAKFTEISNLTKVCEAGSPMALREGEIGRLYGLNNYMTQAISSHTSAATGTVLVDGAATKNATKIHVDGLSTAFKAGDMFTIAGDTTKYTVNKAGDLDTADQDIWITPVLQADAADNAAVTVISTATVNNLAFHKSGIVFVSRPLHAPASVESYVTSFNGLSLRVVKDYEISTKEEKLSMDVLYNYAVVRPEVCVRYLG